MPAGSIDLSQIASFTRSVTYKYLNRKGSKYGLINDARPRTLAAGKLFKRASIPDWVGGSELAVKIKLDRARVTTWMGPTDKLQMTNTTAPQECRVPRRYLGYSVFKSFAEIDQNKGMQEVIYDVVQSAMDDICIDTIWEFEDTLWAKDGNYTHDGNYTDYLLPLGLKYWGTIDGLHITGDTGKAVGNISPYTYTDWKNPYINPITSTDFGTDGPITSIFDWRSGAQRMLRLMSWEAIKPIWGKAAKDVEDSETKTFNRGEGNASDLMIVCDAKTQLRYGDIVFDREDNVGRDQGRTNPVFKGIDIEDCDQLGMGTYGYGKDSAGNALWTDRGGSYANGNWANYGETMFINTKLMHVLTHEKHAPFLADVFRPEGMFGLAWEGDWWLQTVCRSRKRGIGYMGPYPFQ